MLKIPYNPYPEPSNEGVPDTAYKTFEAAIRIARRRAYYKNRRVQVSKRDVGRGRNWIVQVIR